MSETIKAMGSLHKLLAEEIREQIISGTKVMNKEGDIVSTSASATVLNVARQFLRDNNIQCQTDNNPELRALTEALPFDE